VVPVAGRINGVTVRKMIAALPPGFGPRLDVRQATTLND
jgi:hypothetical protein